MRFFSVGLAIWLVLAFLSAQTGQVPDSLKPYIGKPVPDVVMIDLDGKKHKISDFKGKVLLLNFWSPH